MTATVTPSDPAYVVVAADTSMVVVAGGTSKTIVAKDTSSVVVAKDTSKVIVAGETSKTVVAKNVSRVVVACKQGPRGVKGDRGPAGSADFEMEAGENLNANLAVKTDNDGKVYVASNLVPEDILNVIGFSTASALAGETTIITKGLLHNAAWNWVLGAVYLGDRTMTQTPPVTGFSMVIATATSPNDLISTFYQPIELTA